MNNKTLVGLLLIVAIFVGFQWLNRPSQEEIAKQRYNDSIAQIQYEQQLFAEKEATQELNDSVSGTDTSNDSIKEAKFGLFANVAKGDSTLVEIETDLLKLKFSPKGGNLTYAELKKYKTFDSLPLVLFDSEDENSLDFVLQTADNRVLSSSNFYFTPEVRHDTDFKTVTMRLNVNDTSKIDFIYTIQDDSYKIDFDIVAHNMTNLFPPMTNQLGVQWECKISQKEKGRKFENRYSTLNYRFFDKDMDKLSDSKTDSKTASTPLQWIVAKDQFFSTVLLSKQSFQSTRLSSVVMPQDSKYLKSYSVESAVAFDPTGNQPTNLQWYLVPNQYKILSSFNKGLESSQKPELQGIVPLGWTLFRWVSQLIIIPLFNFFGSFMTNYGLIILLMTVVIKIIILPFTFKSYMSTAKMRVLKPQIDAINGRIPADKALERQQAQMALYKSVGVSPMGGCLPMLLQMPILFAMFAFFPSAIELRQQSFLWASDLSSYDTVPFLTWNFDIPLLGSHLSLFCLLMTATNIIYTKINMSSNMGQPQQMAMMKWMMYLMPLMFLFMFNDYSSGLSYYYFISLLITIGQTYLFRLFVDENKLLKKLELSKANKKPKKKSGFMERLETAQKEQQKRLREHAKKKN
ncbi:MAG: membrane protein insertase YidC [Prevotellaceae bacterium]|jgi:YidC/Oxa1 family membrane protein insertase|nr:membrane protein insertase YidC [Prevotellaceae bacterium]